MGKIAKASDWFSDILPEKFDPSQTGGFSGTFSFEISGDRGGDWSVTIDGEDLTVQPGRTEKSVFTVSMTDESFLELMNGEIDGQQAFMTGKLKFKGNMGKAMKLQSLLF